MVVTWDCSPTSCMRRKEGLIVKKLLAIAVVFALLTCGTLGCGGKETPKPASTGEKQ